MAKLNNVVKTGTNSNAGDKWAIAVLATGGVVICLILTLMGIKIWWSKRRLTFDHNRTNNGAAGGATPTVPLRARKNRDKRITHEIHEPVEIHGIFRRRQESDLDIIPTKQLPPVRIRKIAQSTPLLFSPPTLRHTNKTQCASPNESPQVPTPTLSLAEELPTFDEFEQKFSEMQMKEAKNIEISMPESIESIPKILEPPPQPPKRLKRRTCNEQKLMVGMNKFMKAKLSTVAVECTQSLQNLNESRMSGPEHKDNEFVDTKLNLNKCNPKRSHSVEEFGERRLTGYIKYEEIDVEGLEDFRQKWESVQINLNVDSPISFQCRDRADYEHAYEHKYDRLNGGSSCELCTIEDGSTRAYTVQSPFEERRSWQLDAHSARNYGTPVSQSTIDFTSDEEFANELGGSQTMPAVQPVSAVTNSSSQNGSGSLILATNSSAPHSPFNLDHSLDPSRIEDTTWCELEANIKQDEREKSLWFEIEKDLDLNGDFVTNIEDEFNKIRHSYEQNEAAFLENNGTLKRLPEQVCIASPEPEGFGKNIDEDWASFESLAQSPIIQPTAEVARGKPVVQFNFADLADVLHVDELIPTKEPWPASFVRTSAKFTRQLSNIEDVEEPVSPVCRRGVISCEENPDGVDFSADYVHEHNKHSIFEPVPEPLIVQTKARARPRPRQKVTFDISSIQYIQSSRENEDVTDEERSGTDFQSPKKTPDSNKDTAPMNFPAAVQRITKIHAHVTQCSEVESNAPENETDTTPFQFSSPSISILPLIVPKPNEKAEIDVNNFWLPVQQREEQTPKICISSTSPTPSTTLQTFLDLTESPIPARRQLAPSALEPSSTVSSSTTETEQEAMTH